MSEEIRINGINLTERGVRAGDVVRLTRPYSTFPVGAWGIVNGIAYQKFTNRVDITFMPSQIYHNSSVVTASGFTTRDSLVKDLCPTDAEQLVWFWRTPDGKREEFAMWCRVWEWEGNLSEPEDVLSYETLPVADLIEKDIFGRFHLSQDEIGEIFPDTTNYAASIYDAGWEMKYDRINKTWTWLNQYDPEDVSDTSFPTEIEAVLDCARKYSIPPYTEAIVHEVWVVTNFLYDRLRSKGVPTAIYKGLKLWGRTATGCALKYDSCLSEIAATIFLP